MKEQAVSIYSKLLSAIFFIMISVRCSIQPKIEGEFGTVRAPNSHQVALINLKDGKSFIARKIQEEHDSLFSVLLDYSVREVASDSVESIEIRRMTEPESTGKSGSKMSEEEKKKAAYMGFGCARVFTNTVGGMKP